MTSSGRTKPIAKIGGLPSFAKARTHKGVVSIPSPPPKPAFENPMSRIPALARTIVTGSSITPLKFEFFEDFLCGQMMMHSHFAQDVTERPRFDRVVHWHC